MVIVCMIQIKDNFLRSSGEDYGRYRETKPEAHADYVLSSVWGNAEEDC